MAAEIRGGGRRAWVGSGDLGDPAVVERLFDEAVAALGPLDGFVGNAGIWPAEDLPVEQMPDGRWVATMRANLDAVFFTTRAALRRMRSPGRVVLVGSTAGQRGEAFHADYAATKGAMIALVKSLCVECAPGITVNCVAPGWVDTEMSWPAFGEGGRERIARTIPAAAHRPGRGHRGADPLPVQRSRPAHHGRGPQRERRQRAVRLG